MLWFVLLQFICRMTFGLAAAMWATPWQLITSGYYRVHLWVLMGCNTFATLIAWSFQDTLGTGAIVWQATASVAFVSYVGAVCWLYEKPRPGRVALLLVALLGLFAATQLEHAAPPASTVNAAGADTADPAIATNASDISRSQLAIKSRSSFVQHVADHASAGWLIGTTMAAMFLGHWYLNNPSMQLAPLRRLVLLIGAAVVLRGLISGSGVVAHLLHSAEPDLRFWALISLRWLAGLIGTGILAVMTWQTLKIPNTQSATGILYVGVIFVFLGELTAQLLAPGAIFPL